RDAGLVRHVARGEHQGGLLAMQISKLHLELDQGMIGAGDIARAAGTGTETGRGRHHRPDHLRVLTHAEVIVRAPDHDLAGARRRVPDGIWKPAGDPLEINEHAVALFVPQSIYSGCKIRLIIHACVPLAHWASSRGRRAILWPSSRENLFPSC